ncbi:MAG TPA: glycosyltransferase [Thermoplasmata archaeon]|nr:glycosyltransferase [Thermoplasmata archaeon]
MVEPIWWVLLLIGFLPIAYLFTNAAFSRRRAPRQGRIRASPAQITILVPVHAEPASTFAACLDSLAAQGSPVVVVGDGVDEPYRSLARERGAEFVAGAASGKKAALARGLARVTTPFVLFVDADSQLPPGAAVRLAGYFTAGVGGVGANLFVRDTGGAVASAAEFVERAREVVLRAMSSRGSVPYLDGACVMHRTELIRDYLSSAEFQELRVLGRRTRLGDDWQLTDFLLRRGYRTVKAYDVRVETAPKESLAGFVRQNVRWARSNWIRLGSYLRHGFPRAAGRFYTFEVSATYLLPIITLATLLGRLPIVAHAAARSSATAGGLFSALVRAAIGLPHDPVVAAAHIASMVAGAFATGAFVGAAVAFGRRPAPRAIACGALAMAVLFATSIYGLLTFWVEPRWADPGSDARAGRPASRPTRGPAAFAEPGRPRDG